MVAQKPEAATLRKDSLVVIKRTIFEAENQMAGNAITLCDLCHLAVGEALASRGRRARKACLKPSLWPHGNRSRVQALGAGRVAEGQASSLDRTRCTDANVQNGK